MQEKTIGQNLQVARERAGLKQHELADKLNDYFISEGKGFPKKNSKYEKNDVEQWENDRKEIRPPRVIIALADILHTDCHEILTGVKKEDSAVADELGLSGIALEVLRNRHDGGIINFFLDNNLVEPLREIKEYIEMPNEIGGKTNNIRNIDYLDLKRYRFVERLKTWRNVYQQTRKAKRAAAQEGGPEDGKAGNR